MRRDRPVDHDPRDADGRNQHSTHTVLSVAVSNVLEAARTLAESLAESANRLRTSSTGVTVNSSASSMALSHASILNFSVSLTKVGQLSAPSGAPVLSDSADGRFQWRQRGRWAEKPCHRWGSTASPGPTSGGAIAFFFSVDAAG